MNACKWLILPILIFLTGPPSSPAQSQDCTQPPSGLVSWWRAEGDGLDNIGGNTALAALLPGGVSFTNGEVGQGFLLRDTNSYLIVPSSPSLDVGAGSGFTIEGWIKVASVSGFHPIVEWHGNTREEAGVQLWLNSNPSQSGALFGAVTDINLSQHPIVSPSGILQPNVFQHVAMTFDKVSGLATLYINGMVVAQLNMGTVRPATTYDLWFGHRPLDVPGDWTYGTSLGGILDELGIYNRALGSNEIAAIYNAGSFGKCDINSGSAPVITQQPTNETVAAGNNAIFTVTATGSPTLHYQWYGPGTNQLIAGAVNSTLVVSNVQPSQGGNYFVFITNQFGFAISSNALLTVNSGGSSDSGLIVPNSYATNQIVGADGTLNEVLKMQMVYSATQFPASPITITEIRWRPDQAVGGPFSITVSNLQVKLSTTAATVDHLSNIFAENTGTNEIVVFNGVANLSSAFTILSNGTTAFDIKLTLQTPFVYDPTKGNLLVETRNLFGSSPAVGNLVNGTTGADAVSRVFTYDPNGTNAMVNDTGGDVLQIIYTTLTNASAPVITKQPTNQTVAVGGTATFSVTATGSPTLHYQWYDPSETAIPGAVTSTLTLSNVQPGAAGAYFVSVTNQFGFATSSNAVLTVVNPPPPSCVSAPTNIVAWWPAEGNGVDVIGGVTATLQGGATFAPGKVGQAFLLNNTNDYLTALSSNLNIAAATGSFSVEAWIKVADVAGYHPIVEWNDAAGHGGVHMWILPYTGESAGVLFANLVDTSGFSHSFHSPGGTVSTNVFQHVALTYDHSSGLATLYLNGNVVAQMTSVFSPQTSFPFFMGHRPGDPSYLGGLLDEVSLYSRALSANEIAAVYNAGANGKCPVAPTPHLVINSQPNLNLSLSGDSPVLTWPAWAGDAVLQAAGSLNPPIEWTNIPLVLKTNGDNLEFTLPTRDQQGYFRLVHP